MNKKYTSKQIIDFIRQKKEPFWLKEREGRALALFHRAAEGVPAYKDFLAKNRIQHEKVTTWQDFQLVPPVSKKNYLQQYPLEMLCWDGTHLKRAAVLAPGPPGRAGPSTSGGPSAW